MIFLTARIELLIVDDQEDLRRLLKSVFEAAQSQLRIDTAGSLAEAKVMLSQQRYDAVLTDMHMPGGSGLELIAFINAHHPTTATALMSSGPLPRPDGADLSFHKPYAIEAWLASLRLLSDLVVAGRRRTEETKPA
jgi:CheY-like chemotaxis protein